MAVLGKIRQRSFFLIIIIALALFAFVLADLFRSGGFSGGKALKVIGEVNGSEIKTPEFRNNVERASNGRAGMSSVNSVWDRMVESTLVKGQLEKAGIHVDSEHLKDAISTAYANDPTFKDEDGNFDYAKVQEYVTELKETNRSQYNNFWLGVEKDRLESAASDVYFNMIKAGINFTNKEGEIAHKSDNETLNLQFVQLPYSSIVDSTIVVSKSEIADYIKKNKKEFEQEANVDLVYVKIDEVASLEDEKEISKSLQALVGDTYEYNDQIKANDTIAGFANTKDIEEFVNSNSSTKYNARFEFKSKLNKEVADNLFEAEIGKVYGPYKDGAFIKLAKLVEEAKMPDSAKASHILVAWEGLRTGQDVTRTKEQAKTLADSIKTLVSKSGDKFKELASKFSADKSNSEKGGDLGYFTPGRMVPAFNDYVFTQKTGDVGVVETQFGYHIIKIEDQKNIQKAVKIAYLDTKIEPSEKTIGDIYAKATNFVINARSKDFDAVAKENDLKVSPINDIKELDEYIPSVGQNRGVVRWAFNEENKVGAIKSFDIPSGYFITKLVARSEKGLKTVEDASTVAVSAIRKQKKAKQLIAKISGKDLQAIASSNNTSVRTASAVSLKSGSISGAGIEKEVVGTAFGLAENTVSDAIKGDKGVYVIKVTAKTPAQELASYKGIANKNVSTIINGTQKAVTTALKDNAKIIDRRVDIY